METNGYCVLCGWGNHSTDNCIYRNWQGFGIPPRRNRNLEPIQEQKVLPHFSRIPRELEIQRAQSLPRLTDSYRHIVPMSVRENLFPTITNPPNESSSTARTPDRKKSHHASPYCPPRFKNRRIVSPTRLPNSSRFLLAPATTWQQPSEQLSPRCKSAPQVTVPPSSPRGECTVRPVIATDQPSTSKAFYNQTPNQTLDLPTPLITVTSSETLKSIPESPLAQEINVILSPSTSKYFSDESIPSVQTPGLPQLNECRSPTLTSPSQEKIPGFKVYVGNLDLHPQKRWLQGLFESYGRVIGCQTFPNYAFVYMEDERSGIKAIQSLFDMKRNGKRIAFEVAEGQQMQYVELVVRRLPRTVITLDIRRLFAPYGTVIDCYITEGSTAFARVIPRVPIKRVLRETNEAWLHESCVVVQRNCGTNSRALCRNVMRDCEHCGLSHPSETCPRWKCRNEMQNSPSLRYSTTNNPQSWRSTDEAPAPTASNAFPVVDEWEPPPQPPPIVSENDALRMNEWLDEVVSSFSNLTVKPCEYCGQEGHTIESCELKFEDSYFKK